MSNIGIAVHLFPQKLQYSIMRLELLQAFFFSLRPIMLAFNIDYRLIRKTQKVEFFSNTTFSNLAKIKA